MTDLIRGLRVMLTRADKFYLLGVVCLLSIGALMEIAGLGLLLPLVAAFTKPELLEQNRLLYSFRHCFAGASDAQFMLICCGFIALLCLLKNVWLFFSMHIYTRFVYGRISEISCNIFSNLLHSRYVNFADRGKVALNTMIIKVEQMCNMVMLPVMMITVDLLTIVFISLMLFVTIPWVVAGCCGMFFIGTFLIYFPLRHLNGRIGSEISSLTTQISKVTYYSLEDVKNIKILGNAEFFLTLFRNLRLKKNHVDSLFYIFGQIPRLALETLAVFSAVAVLAVMLWQDVPAGTIILSFSLLIAAMSRLLPSVSRINYSLNSIRAGYPFFKEIMEGLKLENEKLGTGEPLNFESEIQVKDLVFVYPGTEKKILEGVSFSLKRNSSLAIVGPTGGGKSTLIDLLLGLYQPQSGEILVDGKNISDCLGAWRHLIGFVPQFIVLADTSVAANVALGVEDEKIDRNRVREVLRIAQLEKFVDSLEHGMETHIGDNGIRLSGGQRQRLGIARALYRDPEIIIFDEATSALDSETEQALIDAIDCLAGEKTLIMVAHRLSTLEKCEQRLELKGVREDNGSAH